MGYIGYVAKDMSETVFVDHIEIAKFDVRRGDVLIVRPAVGGTMTSWMCNEIQKVMGAAGVDVIFDYERDLDLTVISKSDGQNEQPSPACCRPSC